MSLAIQKIVGEMSEVVPPGQVQLDHHSRDELRWLTGLLLDADADAVSEYRRYQQIARRGLHTTRVRDRLRTIYRGRRVLVTGGTGCIGSILIREILGYDPAEVFCIYAMDDKVEPVPGVVYVNVDIRDESTTRDAIRRMRPDVVFHCAAQRSPWLAERAVARTLQTNIVGTRNVLRAARDVDAERVVHASTGKAMRYYTADVYAASKKIAEWLVSDYVYEGRNAAVARFTHVVDNAVLLERVDDALARPDGVIRVHDPNAALYAQSALESAQLLVLAGLSAEAADRGASARGVAMNCLGEPVGLLDVVIGRINASDHRHDATIYLSGYDKGYEYGNPPGLYDPANANDLTPLVNAIEARTAAAHGSTDNVDRFDIALPPSHGKVDELVDGIDRACAHCDPLDALAELARATRDVAEAMFGNCPEDLFGRIYAMASNGRAALPTTRQALACVAS